VIATAMTYVGISPFWGKAIHGIIILAALLANVALTRLADCGPFRRAALDVR
jgi:ribose/xylose/arabinose/galactoside ABC-type transport system permease subunit